MGELSKELIFLYNLAVFHCLALLLGQPLAQALIENYVINKTPTELNKNVTLGIKFRP
jgi:hypothetical protein